METTVQDVKLGAGLAGRGGHDSLPGSGTWAASELQRACCAKQLRVRQLRYVQARMAPGRVQPLNKPRIVKKRTKKFKRHQSDRKITVKVGYQLLVLHFSTMAHRD